MAFLGDYSSSEDDDDDLGGGGDSSSDLLLFHKKKTNGMKSSLKSLLHTTVAQVEGEIAHLEQNHQLSNSAIAFLCIFAIFEIAVVAVNFTNVIVMPVVVCTNSALLWVLWYRLHSNEVSLDLVIRMFGIGFLPAAILASLPGLALFAIALVMCFSRDDRDRWVSFLIRTEALETDNVSGPWPQVTLGSIVFFLFLAFVINGLLVESIKYSIPVHFMPMYAQDPVRERTPNVYFVAAVAGTLGMATFESMMTVCAFGFEASLPRRLITALGRGLFNTPMQAICGGFIGVALTRRFTLGEEVSWFRAIGIPALLHGTFEFVQIGSMLIFLSGVAPEIAAGVGAFGILAILCSSMFILHLNIVQLAKETGTSASSSSKHHFRP